jgi:hypothetical protein
MSTAAAKAKSIKPERNLTDSEAWQAVEEFQISLSPPNRTGRWLAVWGNAEDGVYTFGATPVEAVEAVLRQIGEVTV